MPKQSMKVTSRNQICSGSGSQICSFGRQQLKLMVAPVKLQIVPFFDPENKPRELHRPFEVTAELPASEADHTYTLHVWQWQRHAVVHLSSLINSSPPPPLPSGPQVSVVITPFLEDQPDVAIALVTKHIQYHTTVFGFTRCIW